MKKLKSIVICLFFVIPLTNFSQLMENGGFEIYNSEPSGNQISIEHAVPYKNLNGTSDMVYPLTYLGGTPRNGDGCARIAWGYLWDEYFYGRTLSLTAGNNYLVTFWVRKQSASQLDVQIGAYISPNVPVPMNINPYIQTVVPQVTTQLNSTNYMKVSFCYTPTQTGVHYITFGSFAINNMPNNEDFTLAYIDDISVELAGASNAIANIAPIQSLFCQGSPIVLDGTASSGEVEYEWNIYDIVNGNEILKYDGPRTDGTVGTINVNTLLGSNLISGHCYRAYLTVYNGCDHTANVDFCVFDPTIDFM